MFKRFALSLVVVCGLLNASESTVVAEVTTAATEAPVRFAAVRNFFSNCWNSNLVQFPCDMINPMSYVAACKDMYAAGIREAVPTLWANHKAVIAGTTVATTAAALAVAYYKGWLKKAQDWTTEKINQLNAARN